MWYWKWLWYVWHWHGAPGLHTLSWVQQSILGEKPLRSILFFSCMYLLVFSSLPLIKTLAMPIIETPISIIIGISCHVKFSHVTVIFDFWVDVFVGNSADIIYYLYETVYVMLYPCLSCILKVKIWGSNLRWYTYWLKGNLYLQISFSW